MEFHRLPDRSARAAGNMAADLLLLRRAPGPRHLLLRHYEWQRPAWTFGYSQKSAAVRALISAADGVEIMRRPTGGGVVDHRNDWTYALILPRGHPLEEEPAPKSYRSVHQALRDALACQKIPAVLEENNAGAEKDALMGVCFARPEISDVVHSRSRRKIAGAAQKRTREGLLLQGSVDRGALGDEVGEFNWDLFYDDFTAALSTVLHAEAALRPWPEINEEELSALTEQYSAPEWIQLR